MTIIIIGALQHQADRVEALRRAYPSVTFVVPPSREEFTAFIGEADVFFGAIRPEEFAAARKLRWIQASSAGVEWLVKIPALIESDVIVTNTRGAHAATIAEHAFALLLALTRALRQFDEFQRRQVWARGLLTDRLVAIKGLTMGIVGIGNIGRAIARRAAGFEMEVLAVDAQPVPAFYFVAEVWPLSRLNELCRRSHVLVITAPITPQTRGMIGAEQLELLPPGAYLLALSRGGIVDEEALLAALQSGRLAGAGLDVTAVEPLPPGHPLWTAPNLILTPHSSAASKLTNELVWSIFAENIGRFLRGEPLINVVDKRRGY